VHVLSVENGAEKQMGSFWIKPTAFPLDVEHGPPGTPFAAHLKGVGWTETANIYTVVYDDSYIGYVCAFNSQGDVEIPLQATGDPGWHFIDLYPAIYRGEEQRPRNFSRLTRTVRDAPISASRDGETASGRNKETVDPETFNSGKVG
jgi:hypothetical protein